MQKHRYLTVLFALIAGLLHPVARAEKADRLKDLTIEADQRSVLDLIRRHYVVSGNVVMTQGSLVMRAHQAEVRETPDGYKNAVLTGTAGQKVNFRQKRDGVDEFIDGSADRIEFDSKLEQVRFTGNAVVRRLRGEAVADEVKAPTIIYDNLAELFSAAGNAPTSGTAGSSSATGSERVKMTLAPRVAESEASAPAPTATPNKPAAPAAKTR